MKRNPLRPYWASRPGEISRVRDELERTGFPRLQMLLIVVITAGSGFVASYLMLHLGLLQMWLRYLCAFGVAYGVFLLLLWFWLRASGESADVPDFSSGHSPSGADGGHLDHLPDFGGQGGHFGGGGASGSFEGPGPGGVSPGLEGGSVGDVLGDTVGSVAQTEELAIPLLVIVVLASLALSSAWIIWSAPWLFAELLVDGVLAATFYRGLRRIVSRHWLETAVIRTALPFGLTALFFVILGLGMAAYAPGAHSLGEVIAHSRSTAQP